MKTSPTFLALAGVLALLSAGCIAVTKVQKVEPGKDPEGIRYSLPATFLVGMPKEDGTVEFTTEFLPDSENTYAVKTYSFMAKHKLDLTLANGLLTKVDSTQNTADAAKALIDSAGNLAEKHITEKRKEVKAAQDEAKTAKKEEETAAKAELAAAETAVITAQSAQAKAEDDLEKARIAEDSANPATVLAVKNAEVDLRRAKANLEDAETKRNTIQAKVTSLATGLGGAGNISEQQKKKEDEENAAKAKLAAAETDVATAQSAKAKAENALTTAKNAGNSANPATASAVEKAEADVRQANTDLKDAETKRNAVQAEVTRLAGLKAYGPIIYRVVNKSDRVELVPVHFNIAPPSTANPSTGSAQLIMDTSKKIEADTPPTPKPDLTLKGIPVVTLPADGNHFALQFASEGNLTGKPSEPTAVLLNTDGQVIAEPVASRDGRRKILVMLDPTTPPGDYLMEITYSYDPKQPAVTAPHFPLVVRKAPAQP